MYLHSLKSVKVGGHDDAHDRSCVHAANCDGVSCLLIWSVECGFGCSPSSLILSIPKLGCIKFKFDIKFDI